LTSQGLQLRRGMSFGEWADVGRRLARIADGSAWALGDWIIYGQEAYGRRYQQALEATDLDYKTLRNYACVARRFPQARRLASLSFQHHADVSALEEPEQDLWLYRCQTLRWSRRELRRQLAARNGQVVDATERVTLRVEITPERERRWREAATIADCALPELLTRAVDEAADTLLGASERSVSATPPEAAPSTATVVVAPALIAASA
jgi:hypothetical protein